MQLLQNTNELRTLTDAVNEAIAEEYNLFGFPDNVPVLSPGVVRVACRVFTQHQAAGHRDELMHHVLRVNDLVTRKLDGDAAVPLSDDDHDNPPPDARVTRLPNHTPPDAVEAGKAAQAAADAIAARIASTPPPGPNGFTLRPDGTEQTPWDLRSPEEMDALEKARATGEKMAHENVTNFAAAVNGGD